MKGLTDRAQRHGEAQDNIAISHEDVDRARDRARVIAARRRGSFGSRFNLIWLLIGPGILVMLGENDGPSMISYAATGATYGVGFFVPFIVLTFIMAIVVQQMTVRLAAVTHRGHAELIFERFGPFWGWFSMVDLGIGNFLTLITEFIAVRAGLGFFHVKAWESVLAALILLYTALMTHRYWTWERITLAVAIFNLIFVPVALLAHPDWHAIGRSMVTWKPLVGGINKEFLLISVSNIGATVTPWMLFFQQSAEVDKGITGHDLGFGNLDTVLGAALAAIAAIATLLATTPLFLHHMAAGNFQGAQFAQALQPYIGRVGASLFALGIVEAGMVACVTISVSSAYAFGEVVRQPHSINLPMQQGKSFYAVVLAVALAAGLIVLLLHSLVYVVLVVNVIAVLAMPPALLFLYLLATDRELMGDAVSPTWNNVLTLAVVTLLTAAGILFGMSVIAPHVFAALARL